MEYVIKSINEMRDRLIILTKKIEEINKKIDSLGGQNE